MALAISGGGGLAQIGSVIGQVFYALFMFALVVVLCVLVVRLWVQKGNPMLASRGRNMQMLEFMPLGTGKGLYLLRVPDAIWLIGVTEHEVSVLREYPANMQLADVAATNAPAVLPGWLARIWHRLRKQSASRHTEVHSSGTAFSQELLRRIEQLKGPKE